MYKAGSPEFLDFIRKFKDLYSKKYTSHYLQVTLMPDGDSNNEDTQLNICFLNLG